MELALKKQDNLINSAYMGKSISCLAEMVGLNHYQLRRYLKENPEFKATYDEARSEGMEYLADSLLDIITEYNDIFEARLASDNIKWLLSKRKPQVYGDKVQLELYQAVDIRLALSEARQRVIDVTPQPSNVIDISTGLEPVDVQIPTRTAASKNTLPDIFT